MVKVEDKARTQTKGPRALCGSSRPGGWMGGGKEPFVPAPCSLYPRNGNTLPLDQHIL